MSVFVDELEIVPQQVPAPPGEPTPRAAPDIPPVPVEEQVERTLQMLDARAARLRAD